MIEQRTIQIGDFLRSDLSQFDLLTTADCHTTLHTCSRINPVIENNRSNTLIEYANQKIESHEFFLGLLQYVGCAEVFLKPP